MALLGEVECRECKVGHALERDEIAFFESVGVIGEKFEQSAHLAVAPQQSRTTMEAMPSARQASRFTRGSASALSQRSNCRRAMLSPVSPERTCKRAPIEGAHEPALARQTISLPWGNASAVPVAPVMYWARSTRSCRAASSSGSSRARRALGPSPPPDENCLPSATSPDTFRAADGSSGWGIPACD